MTHLLYYLENLGHQLQFLFLLFWFPTLFVWSARAGTYVKEPNIKHFKLSQIVSVAATLFLPDPISQLIGQARTESIEFNLAFLSIQFINGAVWGAPMVIHRQIRPLLTHQIIPTFVVGFLLTTVTTLIRDYLARS